MDKVVQRNAAVAQESAAASNDLSQQANVLRESVHELTRLFGTLRATTLLANTATREISIGRHERPVLPEVNGHAKSSASGMRRESPVAMASRM
jgi:hypothetical protein